MAGVFQVLEADHQEVKQMLANLSSSPASGDGTNREELAEKLVIEVSKHEAVEEMPFWPPVRQRVPGGEQLTLRALEQEGEGKHVLDDLRKAHAGEEAFAEALEKLAKAGAEHIAYEENELLSLGEREALGAQLVESKRTAPTRPHPHGPDAPGALETVGGAAAVMDKARDAVTGRG